MNDRILLPINERKQFLLSLSSRGPEQCFILSISVAGFSMIKVIEGTGDFFEEWNEITPKIHIRKFKEQTA